MENSLNLKNRIFLAPMEEVNDPAFRLLCKKAGCGLTYTGMINPLTKQKIILKDKPALQLFCNNTKGIREFIKKYDSQVFLWDFNLGCPATNARKHGFGSYLVDLEVIEEILKIMRASTRKPITIKIRKSSNSFNILRIAEQYCDAIAIHPRTRSQGYSGIPNISFARTIKKMTNLPVIYSGNVNLKNANRLLKEFDYVMIGREAIGKPEIFSKLTNTKYDKTFKDYLKLAEKFKLPFRQIKFQAMNFTKGKRKSKKLRLQIHNIKDLKSLKKIFS